MSDSEYAAAAIRMAEAHTRAMKKMSECFGESAANDAREVARTLSGVAEFDAANLEFEEAMDAFVTLYEARKGGAR